VCCSFDTTVLFMYSACFNCGVGLGGVEWCLFKSVILRHYGTTSWCLYIFFLHQGVYHLMRLLLTTNTNTNSSINILTHVHTQVL
jgi:hypothetical protein